VLGEDNTLTATTYPSPAVSVKILVVILGKNGKGVRENTLWEKKGQEHPSKRAGRPAHWSNN